MITVQTIYDAFQYQNIEDNWKDTLNNLQPDTQNTIQQWIQEKWNEFTKTISHVETEEELRHIIIVKYIEFKSHWYMLNTYIQYQTFLTGIPEEETTYKSSVLSLLIGFLEAFIETEEITNINQMLADPIQKELQGDWILDNQSMEEQLNDLYQEKELLQNKYGISSASGLIDMIDSLEEQLKALYYDLENAVVVESKKVTILGSRKIIIKK
ncbi:MAG: hypothetical protein H7A23_11730 [Leptospiraceae bacterium]|nr:hypothetical protein [Leptospiraceae bacterium]MCP5495216.1 hypothetical protein [Leptospiraceae bacterium]